MKTGAGYRGGDRLQKRGYGSKLGTPIKQQLTEKNKRTFKNIFIAKLLYHIKNLFPFLDLLDPVDGEDTQLPENLTVEMGMRLLEEDEGETEMDTAPEGAANTEPAVTTTGPTADENTTAAQTAAAALATTAAATAAAAAKLKASQALSDKLIERAAKEAAEKKEQEKKEQAALAAYMAADRKEKDKWSRRGSNDSSDFGSYSSTNSDMPPLYFTTKNKRDNAIKTRILGGGGGILLLRGC